jgi:iron complex transport system substrate-binding protein
MPRILRRILPLAVPRMEPGRDASRSEGPGRGAPTPTPWARRMAVVVSFVVLAGTACGEDASSSAAGGSPTGRPAAFPVTVEAANGKVTIDERPERIVSLSATATEMLFAIGAGEKVVAVDDQSNYPPEAPTTDLSGLEPNVEAIAKFRPDLVVISDEPGGLEKSLTALDIPVILAPAAQRLDDTYAQIEQLGDATGNAGEATEVVASMQSEIDELVESVPEFEKPPTYYHELDQSYFSVTSETFIGQAYSKAGLENIADEAKGAGSQYPQLSAEFIISADPDFIFLADTKCCGQSAETIARRPGWDQITAVRSGAVVELDDDIASRWGPRIVDFIRIVVEAVSELEAARS